MTLAAYTSLPSTNDEAKRLAMEEQASDGTIVWALEQTAGKGRQNRQWLSAPGNIYSSVILRPTVNVENAAQASFLPALAVASLLAASISEQNITFKWPNDVLLNGKKICGILLESGSWKTLDQKWLVLGCGINLAHSPAETRIPATSMKEHATIMPGVEEALESYAAHLFNWIQRWQREGFQPIRQAWVALLGATGVILGAAYMLYLYRRVVFGSLTKEALMSIKDVSYREVAVFAPLLLIVFVMGIYPAPFLDVMQVSVENLIDRYTSALAAHEAHQAVTVLAK